jgi:hypothetical protein
MLRLCLYPSFYIQWGRGYKKGNRVSYNMIPIRTLSLLTYFTYIFIDIIIYSLGSTLWSSGIFWMMDWVVADSFLDLPSLCVLVPECQSLSHDLLMYFICRFFHSCGAASIYLPVNWQEMQERITRRCWGQNGRIWVQVHVEAGVWHWPKWHLTISNAVQFTRHKLDRCN